MQDAVQEQSEAAERLRRFAELSGDERVLVAVEEKLHGVVFRHFEAILHHDARRRLVERDQAAVFHRVGQAQVAFVPALEAVLVGR